MNSYQEALEKLRSDIHLNRSDIIDSKNRAQSDHEDYLLQSKKEVIQLCLYIQQLERQLSRLYQLNPVSFQMEEFQQQLREDDHVGDNEKDQILEIAQLMNNSTLLKSYEMIIAQYDSEMQKKNTLIKDMERELQQIQFENSNLAQQLYKVKCNVGEPERDGGMMMGVGGMQSFGRDEKEQLVELLKRNHDIVVEKYELQRQRNEGLEKTTIEKEKLYNEIKIENDALANQNYKLSRTNEDLQNEKRILESKLKNIDIALKQTQEDLRSLRVTSEKQDSQLRLQTESSQMLEKSLEDLSIKKHQEVELLTREITQLTVKDKELKSRAYLLEKESIEVKDQLRLVLQELDTRTRENDHLVSLLEDQEQKLALYEQKEKSVQQLAVESKKRLEESNQERDKIMLKEQQYLRQIQRLEERLKEEGQERQERNEKIVDSLRMKHKNILEQKEDEISDTRMKLADAKEMGDKYRLEVESLRKELDKLKDQLREMKEEAGMRYERYNKQMNLSESQSEEKIRQLQRDNERFKEENETMSKNQQQTSITTHELEIKLDAYMRDYERYFDENKRLREILNSLREEKDSALNEINRHKIQYQEHMNEVNDECNQKLSHLTQQLIEAKDRYMFHEKKSTDIMIMQERIVEKWKTEHRMTVDYFQKTVNNLKNENKNFRDKVIEIKGQLRLEKENEDIGGNRDEKKAKRSVKDKSRSKEKTKTRL